MTQQKLAAKEPYAIAYHATWWTCWSTCMRRISMSDLMSDQTSCHMAYDGGYCPQGLTFEQRTEMLDKDPEASPSWLTSP